MASVIMASVIIENVFWQMKLSSYNLVNMYMYIEDSSLQNHIFSLKYRVNNL